MLDWLTLTLFLAGALAVALFAYQVLKAAEGGRVPPPPAPGSEASNTPSQY
jgi:hypothetical protein